MTQADRWLLPDGIEEILPPQAQRVEYLRRHLIDVLDNWGYDFVMPPALEYLESLLTGAGKNLDLRTFKVTDQLSGRMMGLSADATPQVARIDAHSLAPEGVSRLCYCRTVFHTKAQSLLASRTPTQIGAELFGADNIEADIEIISLMLHALNAAEIQQIHLDIGHVGVFNALVKEADLNAQQQAKLFELLKLKCRADIKKWAEENIQSEDIKQALHLFVRQQGNVADLCDTFKSLATLIPTAAQAVQDVQKVVEQINQRFPNVPVNIDLTELRGYNYHSGLVFAAYIPGFGDAIAKGGRYNDTGAAFGRDRAATGFSADLKVLARFGEFGVNKKQTWLAPHDTDPALWAEVDKLRASGQRVITDLNGQTNQTVDGYLKQINGQWQLVKA